MFATTRRSDPGDVLVRRRRVGSERNPEHCDVDERERGRHKGKPRPAQRERREGCSDEQRQVLQAEHVRELEHPGDAVEQPEERRQTDEQDEPRHHRSQKAHREDASGRV